MDKTAFIFPGQGSQYPGMGQKLYDNFPIARQLYDEANHMIGFDLLGRHLKGDPQAFFNTTFGQPAILALSVIAFKIFAEKFGEASFLAGHSLGEYSALVCAGAIEFHDGLKIVHKRAQIMESMKEHCQGKMCAIDGCAVEEIDRVCREISERHGTVVASNYNSAKQCVISGLKEPVRLVGEAVSKLGALVRPLNLDLPFHSPLLEKAVDLFEKELKYIEMRLPKYPVISNVTALPYQNVSEIRKLLAVQIMQPVKWLQTMDFMVRNGLVNAIEFGPKQVLKKFFGDSYPNIHCASVEHESGQVPNLMSKGRACSAPGDILKKCLATVATTRTLDSSAQQQIVQLNDELKRLKQQSVITLKDGEKGKQILREILELKKVPLSEIERRLGDLQIQASSPSEHHIQLFCFPYAGGSINIYKEWPKLLPASIEITPVEYPGRGHKFKEPLSGDIHGLVSSLLPEIEKKINGPFALFGHSLGAVVAFEISKALCRKNKRAECLILSGCPAPSSLKTISSIKGLSDDAFLEKISSLNGTPPELLSKEEFRRFFIPILRSDFSLLDEYAPQEDISYDIPLVLYGGENDPKVAPESIKNWSSYTKASNQFKLFPGDHFYIKNPAKVLEHLTEALCLAQGVSI